MRNWTHRNTIKVRESRIGRKFKKERSGILIIEIVFANLKEVKK